MELYLKCCLKQIWLISFCGLQLSVLFGFHLTNLLAFSFIVVSFLVVSFFGGAFNPRIDHAGRCPPGPVTCSFICLGRASEERVFDVIKSVITMLQLGLDVFLFCGGTQQTVHAQWVAGLESRLPLRTVFVAIESPRGWADLSASCFVAIFSTTQLNDLVSHLALSASCFVRVDPPAFQRSSIPLLCYKIDKIRFIIWFYHIRTIQVK